VLSVVQQIKIGEAQILVWLNRTAIMSSVMPDAAPKPTDRMAVEPSVLSIAASLRGAGKGVRLVIGGAAKAIDGGLASLIARAIATRNMLLTAAQAHCWLLHWGTNPRVRSLEAHRGEHAGRAGAPRKGADRDGLRMWPPQAALSTPASASTCRRSGES
jgi:hypothetical protein